MGLDWYYCPICGNMINRNWSQCKHLDEYWKYFDKEYTNDKTFFEFCKSEYHYKPYIPLTDEEEKLIINNSNSYWLNDEWFHEYHTFNSINLYEILHNFRVYGET